MENASKALIIAGAILVSLLLIAVGMMVLNPIGGIVDTAGAQLDSQEIQAFNGQFTSNSGENIKSATVKQLINTISSSNAANDESRQVIFELNGTVVASDSITSALTKIKTQRTYKVVCLEGDGKEKDGVKTTKGLVYKITITEN